MRIAALSMHAELAEAAGLEQFAADEGVLGRPELRGQREVLEDGLDADLACVLRRVGDDRLRPEQELASSGGMTPDSIFTSVLLPAPLSPISADHLTGVDREVGLAQHLDVPVVLDDPARLQRASRAHRSGG